MSRAIASIPDRSYPAGSGVVRYTWRDPEHTPPSRAAALAHLGRPEPEVAERQPGPERAAWSADRREVFAAARERGLDIRHAAKEAGIARNTGNTWDRLRKCGELLPGQT